MLRRGSGNGEQVTARGRNAEGEGGGYSFESRGVWGKERGYNLVISGGIVRGEGSSGSSVQIGHVAHCDRSMHHFTLRSKSKVDVQWGLFALVHNIGKIHVFAALI